MPKNTEEFMFEWVLPALMGLSVILLIFVVLYAIFVEPEEIQKRKEACQSRGGSYLRHTEMVGKSTASYYYCIRWPALIELEK